MEDSETGLHKKHSLDLECPSRLLSKIDSFLFTVCMGKTDLAFIIDSSGSVGEDNFLEAKNFIWAVARNFDISNSNTRLAILRFSTRANVIFDFKFSANNNVLRLKEMVDNIEYVEGGTKTERALQLAYTDLFSDKGGSRPDVPRILILMTDGKSERALAVARTSMALKRDKKVTIVAVGIGEEVDIEELLSMASSTEDAINVSSFKELKKRVGNIRDKVCDGKSAYQPRTNRWFCMNDALSPWYRLDTLV